jgi:hypothetical protein
VKELWVVVPAKDEGLGMIKMMSRTLRSILSAGLCRKASFTIEGKIQ